MSGGAGSSSVPLRLTRFLHQPFDERLAEHEKEEMDKFLLQHAQRYDFSHGDAADSFGSMFRLLVRERFLSQPNCYRIQPRDHRLRVLQCMRVLMRDKAHHAFFVEAGGMSKLVNLFSELEQEHFTQENVEFGSEMLVESLSILKRFASLPSLAEATGEMKLQRALVALLSTREALVLQCVLVAIYQLVQHEEQMHAIGQLGGAETLLCILTDYQLSFKVLAADLIEVLLGERTFARDVVLHDGVAILLSLLHSDDSYLPLSILRSLDRLVTQPDCARDMRQLGGINVLLSLLSSNAALLGPSSSQMVVAICSVLTTLALDGEAALQIRKANGVYFLGQLLMHEMAEDSPTSVLDSAAAGGSASDPADNAPAVPHRPSHRSSIVGAIHAGHDGGLGPSARAPAKEIAVAPHVLRLLRFVFSTERNRKIFRRLFPPEFFAAFIDVGHFVKDIDRYVGLAQQLSSLAPEARQKMHEALAEVNVGRGPSRHYIKDYAVQELLGKGAFGSVYHVKKDSGERSYAMKELPLDAVGEYGMEGEGHEETANLLKREVQILSQLHHPNIIRYYESFHEGRALYIVMELVEGVTLLDHLNSLSEKSDRMPESRVWMIFSQLCLALRYIHKEQRVVHRDLTPSNIMISVDDVVKMADFGLAKQRMGTATEVMDSVVGTVLYQCPEIVQHESYGEKADIWSLGCILYQMVMLKPPFEGGNPLAVAHKIVEGSYPPLSGQLSPLVHEVVSKLLCVDPAERPDILEVGRLISTVLMSELGRVSKVEHTLRSEVLVEREWRQRHELEALRNKEAVHRLFAQQQLAGTSSNAPPACTRESSPLWRTRKAAKSLSLSISPSRIREIHDPCSRILNQLHKILFISQLPPTMEGELAAQRQVIDKYKRELFSHRNHYRGWNLKDELHKLVSGSQEVVQDIFYGNALGVDAAERQRISYEDLQRLIEQVLAETGYYSLQGSAAEEPPHGPNALEAVASDLTPPPRPPGHQYATPPAARPSMVKPPPSSPLGFASPELMRQDPWLEAETLRPEPLRVLPTISTATPPYNHQHHHPRRLSGK